MDLFDQNGNRLYLTPDEREKFRLATAQVSRDKRIFALMLYYTGCRISEALAVRMKDIDFSSMVITVRTLKQRKENVFRQIPVPAIFLNSLDNAYDLRVKQKRKGSSEQLVWTWTRQYGYTVIIEIMKLAELQGKFAVPKGLRHGFGIACVSRSIPLNMIQKWLGHAQMETTAIYLNASGHEERALAKRLWED